MCSSSSNSFSCYNCSLEDVVELNVSVSRTDERIVNAGYLKKRGADGEIGSYPFLWSVLHLLGSTGESFRKLQLKPAVFLTYGAILLSSTWNTSLDLSRNYSFICILQELNAVTPLVVILIDSSEHVNLISICKNF